jgi:hypothetical protein
VSEPPEASLLLLFKAFASLKFSFSITLTEVTIALVFGFEIYFSIEILVISKNTFLLVVTGCNVKNNQSFLAFLPAFSVVAPEVRSISKSISLTTP